MALKRTRKSPYIYLAIGPWKISNCKEEGHNDENNALLPQVPPIGRNYPPCLEGLSTSCYSMGMLVVMEVEEHGSAQS
ncbi:hypothetical protein AHAS_Ahas14G0257700 [Arachis hypogaea]